MENEQISKEFELASLLGWTNLHIGPDSLLSIPKATYGVPPKWKIDAYRCRMPMWVRDWHDCGKLMVEHKIYIYAYGRTMVEIRFTPDSGGIGSLCVSIANHENLDAAVRFGIVSAVIMKLQTSAASAIQTPQNEAHNIAVNL